MSVQVNDFLRLNELWLVMAPMLIELELGRSLSYFLEDLGSRYFGTIHRDLLLVDTNDIVPGTWQWFLFNGKNLDLDNFQNLFARG